MGCIFWGYCLTGNTGRKNEIKKICHLGTIAQLCQVGYIFATKARIDNLKNSLNSNISSRCPHNMVNVSLLTSEIGSLVWGTLANFNRFRILASLLHRRCSPEANQILHDVWPSHRLVHYIYIFGALAPWRNFTRCRIHFASKSCVLLYWQCYCTALQQQA